MSIRSLYPSTRPSLSLDFAKSRRLDPRIAFSRAQTGNIASYTDSNGLVRFAGPDEPRFDHDPITGESLGLLVEESRINRVRNNTMVGAVPGTPGTFPTYWGVTNIGLNQEIVGVGTDKGISYIDLRFFGTATGTQMLLRWDTEISVVTGQTYSHSVWISKIAGDLPSGSVVLSSNVFSSTGVYLGDFGAYSIKSLIGSSLSRISSSDTITQADATTVRAYMYFLMSIGEVVDFTIRVGMPQFEEGAFPTSVIPTSGSTITRPADNISITGTKFNNIHGPQKNTILVSYFRNGVQQPSTTPISGTLLTFTDGTEDNYVILTGGYTNPRQLRLDVKTNNVIQAQVNITDNGFEDLSSLNKVIATYEDDNIRCLLNQNPIESDITAIIPSISQVNIGRFPISTGHQFTGTINRITNWTTTLSNSQLQTLTK